MLSYPTVNHSVIRLASLLVLNLFIATLYSHAHAQTSTTITGEGVSGDIDKKRRSPTVSVSTESSSDNVKILVDAYVADTDYQKYPIQFDFYVNRKFFTSQIRSTELPGPIGIDVSKDVATPPFNYTIIAKTLHPNREFTTVLNAAAFTSTLTADLDCTLTTDALSEESKEYISNEVTTAQNGNNSLSVTFETNSTPEGHEVALSGSITLTDLNATGTFSIKEDEGDPTSTELTGTISKENETISAIELSSADGETLLSCS